MAWVSHAVDQRTQEPFLWSYPWLRNVQWEWKSFTTGSILILIPEHVELKAKTDSEDDGGSRKLYQVLAWIEVCVPDWAFMWKRIKQLWQLICSH